jgi:SWI/SNF-related matrix-associated actin-dependent regulator 1 of chromatin subfamily A
MIITAKFASVCSVCQRGILSGDRVAWTRGTPAVHATCSEEGRAVAVKVQESKAIDASMVLPCPEGLAYLGYQKAGIAYALSRTGTLIADEMGLGKTVQAIGAINASPEIRRVLVICPASLKINWRNEMRRWLTRDLTIGVMPADMSADVTICNYDILKKLPVAAWDLVILDEAHFCKNPKAARTKLVKSIVRGAKRILALTGTPILNKPIEMWPILQMVNPEAWDPAGYVKKMAVGPGEGAGFFRFAKRYCDAHQERVSRDKTVWVFDGASNLPELQEKLRTTCMVRRLKADVLKELPPKRRQVISVGNGCHDEQTWGDIGDDYETAYKRAKNIPFEEISEVRHTQALQKVEAAVEHIREAAEASGKVVVFAHHKDVIAALAEGLADLGVATLTGDTPNDARQAAVERFQSDTTCRVFIGSIHAAGVGLTLTAASHIIFVELDWTPANLTQAEDRCHRIGQTESVLVQHLVLDGSIDARMTQLIVEKQNIADMALDAETMVDTSGRPIEETSEARKVRMLAEALLSEADVAHIHAAVKYLAERCDGASVEDGMGFNKLDTNFGHAMAGQEGLSVKQAVACRKMLKKYAKQLERGGVAL